VAALVVQAGPLMGWAHGIVDGREVGYGVEATCDVPDCDAAIDRGLAYRCGGSENLFDGEPGCGAYVCGDHNFLDACAICEAS